MKVLFDTNVVLDVMFEREPFVKSAAILFGLVERGEIEGYLCANTITTIHYLATKVVGTKQALKHIEKLLQLFDIAAVNRNVLEYALHSKFADYEDAVLSEAANHALVDAIVTRNKKDFKHSAISVCSPEELLIIIEKKI